MAAIAPQSDAATEAELTAHAADTTAVHGIADTSALALTGHTHPFDEVEGTPFQGLASGRFVRGPQTSFSTSTWTNGAMRLGPWFLPDVVIDRLAVELTGTPGSTGAVIRMFIYDDTGDFYPGALIADSGQIAATSTGEKSYDLPVDLTLPAVAWVGLVTQGSPVTQPTVRTLTLPSGYVLGSLDMAGIVGGSFVTALTYSGVTGALPDPFPAFGSVGGTTPSNTGIMPAIGARIA